MVCILGCCFREISITEQELGYVLGLSRIRCGMPTTEIRNPLLNSAGSSHENAWSVEVRMSLVFWSEWACRQNFFMLGGVLSYSGC